VPLYTARGANTLYHSAELEMTVNILIQIDKLVQLLESPVFTCKSIVFYQGGHLENQLPLLTKFLTRLFDHLL